MHLKRTVLTLASAGAACAGIAAGAPIAAIVAGAVAVGTLAGFSVTDAREGRRKRFDQDNLKEANKTLEAYLEQKRQTAIPNAPPSISVITDEEWWSATPEEVPASRYCRVYRRIVKDLDAGTTIDARYRGITAHLGRGYYCLEDRPENLNWTDVYGFAQIPSTARFPEELAPGNYMMARQPLKDFEADCKAVVNYCRTR